MGNVYLVLTDNHRPSNKKDNRFNIYKEVEYLDYNIMKVIKKYRDLNYKVILLFLGDIYDRSYKSPSKAMKEISSMFKFYSCVSSIFSVVGNHEYTFYKYNPFWSLVKSVDSERASSFKNGHWIPNGDFPIIRVVDSIVDGDVEFIFNHYGSGVYPPSNDKYTIGLFHQDIVYRAVLDDAKQHSRCLFELSEEEMKSKFKHVYLDDQVDLLAGYNYCMFGHNHLLYGKWEDDSNDIIYHHLGSLLNPNHKEISNDFLERNIPAVIVKDGKLVKIEDNVFTLMRREEVVDEMKVRDQQLRYQQRKKTKEIIDNNLMLERPIDSVKASFNSEQVNMIIDGILEKRPDPLYNEFKKMLSTLGGII